MLKEPGIHTIHIFGGTWKDMHNTQTTIQKRSYLATIYTSKYWDHNDNEYDNRPQDTESNTIVSVFLIILSINSSAVPQQEPI